MSFLNRVILAPLLCGFLNTTHGGKMFLGVKRTGLITGITLDRKKRDLASDEYQAYQLRVCS